ncbi:phage baseplate assembly protein V [Meridianimarinicoccus sp. RP-17]
MNWGVSDLDRRFHSGLRIGTVTAVDATAAAARVTLGGETETDWLPWLAERAGIVGAWSPVSIGEQVLVASIGGDTAQGIIVGSLYSGANPAPSQDGGTRKITLGAASITMTEDSITVAVGGTQIEITDGLVAVTASDSTFSGTLTVEGLLSYMAGMAGQGGGGPTATITGDISVTGGDVTADGISLKGHTHPGDSGGNTGSPQ